VSREPAIVTGLGAVSGYGTGIEALRAGLLSGRTAIGPFDRFDAEGFRTRVASQVPGSGRVAAADDARLTLAERFALDAAAEALAAAGLGSLAGLDAGLFFGSSTGGMFESEEFFAALENGRAPVARLVAQQPCGPGDAVARRFRVEGPVLTVAAACASATLAFASALDALRSGDVDVALVGGADSLCRLTYGGFNALRAVDELPCRPFRVERQGMSIGEGAAVLVLERPEHAARRGASALGALLGAGASCDAHHMTAPDPAGDGITRAVRAALDDAGLGPEAIDFLNLHGTGTPANDRAEGRMVGTIFGDRAASLPTTSTKAAVGHYLGAAGAVEAVATLLGLAEGLVHPAPGEGTVDRELGVDLVVGEPRAVPGARRALSTNLAFGGANAACVLARPEVVA